MTQFKSFAEFWPYYLREHSHPACRAFHYAASTAVVGTLVTGAFWTPWALVALPVVGYGPAWLSHRLIEKNRPTTFAHPLWSAVADFRMYGLWLSGRIKGHLNSVWATEPTAGSSDRS